MEKKTIKNSKIFDKGVCSYRKPNSIQFNLIAFIKQSIDPSTKPRTPTIRRLLLRKHLATVGWKKLPFNKKKKRLSEGQPSAGAKDFKA